MLSQNKKQKHLMKSSFTVSEKALAASYHVAKLIGQQKKPQTIGEKLLKLACLEIVRLMLGQKEVEEIKTVSLSAVTIKRRIDDMSSDILETLINKLKTYGHFSLRIDETTDITKKAQLLGVVRFVDGDSIREEYLFCEELPKGITGQEIFRVTNEFFSAHGINWNNSLNICADGASAMVGEGRDSAALVKRQNRAIQITHCCIHRKALMVKNFTNGNVRNDERLYSYCKLYQSKSLEFSYFFFALRRNGITASVNAILHCCALAFTWKSACKTLPTEA